LNFNIDILPLPNYACSNLGGPIAAGSGWYITSGFAAAPALMRLYWPIVVTVLVCAPRLTGRPDAFIFVAPIHICVQTTALKIEATAPLERPSSTSVLTAAAPARRTHSSAAGSVRDGKQTHKSPSKGVVGRETARPQTTDGADGSSSSSIGTKTANSGDTSGESTVAPLPMGQRYAAAAPGDIVPKPNCCFTCGEIGTWPLSLLASHVMHRMLKCTVAHRASASPNAECSATEPCWQRGHTTGCTLCSNWLPCILTG
jgi:hypothetical protein